VLRAIRFGWSRSRPHDDRGQPDAALDRALQHRLFLLGTAFMARGLDPKDAYTKALYYTTGPGRGQNWMSVLSEQDRETQAAAE
jgi:hypothetical protein